jgi:hypothetical protein
MPNLPLNIRNNLAGIRFMRAAVQTDPLRGRR